MKNPIILIFVLTLFLAKISQAQIPIGHVYDVNGNAFHGYYNTLNYKPEKRLEVNMVLDDYISCHAIDHKGDSHLVKLRARGSDLYTPVRDGYGSKRIKPKNYKYILFGSDSVFSFKGTYKHLDFIKTTNSFFWYIDGDDVSEFAMGITGGELNPCNYFARNKADSIWYKLKAGTNKKLKPELIRFLGHVPELKTDILENNYKEKDIPELIKKLIYLNALKSQKTLPFNTYWKPEKNSTEPINQIRVLGYDSTHWELEFLHKGKKFQSGYFKQLVPLTPDSLVFLYNGHQQLNTTQFYADGRLDSVCVHNKEQQVIHSYKYKLINPEAVKLEYKRSYTQIKSTTPTKLPTLDTVSFYSNGENILYYEKYEKAQLVSSYYIEDGQHIYQMVSTRFNPKLGSIQNKLHKFSDTINFASSIKEEAEGFTLFKVRVNKKGVIEQITSLYSTYEKHEKFFNYFMENRYKKMPKLGKYLVEGIPVVYEVIIPIHFKFANQSVIFNSYPYNTPSFNSYYPGYQFDTHPIHVPGSWYPNQENKFNNNPSYGTPR